jgi:hypothetical protein
MSGKEMAFRDETGGQFVDDLFLGRAVKIDDHVAAEDNIEGRVNEILVVHEIEPLEADGRAKFRSDAKSWSSLCAAAE